MDGAESLIRTAAAAGVDVCFANPGTTEMPLVAALDAVGPVRAILGLFEGVCTGAADGYGRMADRPALTLLHLGPGFANGIANLHNARRARTPIVNLVGDHPTWHLPFDPPLASDVESLARPVSVWVRTSRTAKELARDGADAIEAALAAPGGVATLTVPHDCQWDPADGPARPRPARPAPAPDGARIAATARRLRDAERPALLLGGRALREPGLRAAARIARATGARVWCETFPARLERGLGRFAPERLPYFPEQAREALAGCDPLVRAGAREPVAFFGTRDGTSRLADEGALECLADPDAGEDAPAALEALADELGAPRLDATGRGEPAADPPLAPPRSGALDPASLGAALAAAQPEGTIAVDEGATSGLPYFAAARAARPHTYLALTGGAIGQGIPCATGAAVACPDRKVLSLQADGSGLYTLQGLWTQAREGLDVVTVVCANRAYRILQIELARAGIAEPGPKARALTDLASPAIDWVGIARGFGVPAVRAETLEELDAALRPAFAEAGPRLIEAVL